MGLSHHILMTIHLDMPEAKVRVIDTGVGGGGVLIRCGGCTEGVSQHHDQQMTNMFVGASLGCFGPLVGCTLLPKVPTNANRTALWGIGAGRGGGGRQNGARAINTGRWVPKKTINKRQR